MIRRPPRSTRTDTLFPTRRSSDLQWYQPGARGTAACATLIPCCQVIAARASRCAAGLCLYARRAHCSTSRPSGRPSNADAPSCHCQRGGYHAMTHGHLSARTGDLFLVTRSIAFAEPRGDGVTGTATLATGHATPSSTALPTNG